MSSSDVDPANVFWGEMSPSEHLVQIYKDDTVFLDGLEGFVAGGLRAGDGVILIATPAHLAGLEHRLLTRGLDVGGPAYADRYLALDAQEMLSRFMVNNFPDETLFEKLVNDLLHRAGHRSDGTRRRVRAFGEMVAVLWARGQNAATVRLEHLWHRFCREKEFCLFCAYPRIGFTQDAQSSMKEICEMHSRVVAGEGSA